MPLMNSEIYDALLDAGADKNKAIKAAESVTTHKIWTRLILLQWMVGLNVALSISIITILLKFLIK